MLLNAVEHSFQGARVPKSSKSSEIMDVSARTSQEAGPRRLPRTLKRSELIARDIVKDIAVQGLRPGAPLPPESSMMDTYGVGRASIREALRILEAQGLILLKPGRNGGPVVARSGPEQLGQALTLFLRMSGATYGDLASFMRRVSPLLAELAAKNPDRAAVRAAVNLSKSNPCAMVTEGGFESPDTGPHVTINRLSGETVLGMFADAVDSVFASHTYALTAGEGFGAVAHRDHVAIAEAVLKGEPAKARKAMADHLENIFEYNQRHIPGLFDRSVEWS